MTKVIKAEQLSKAYQLGDFGTGTISRDLERFWARLRGKEDPFLKIGEVNDRTIKGESDIVWSLRDLNFEIEQGDAVGIIGRNGAGKSTLLKILSRVTSPTAGSVKVKGRIASLLEVGTGFHPELSGKENIFLNGAILGMRKTEIRRKFDEIVEFAGVERYINTPVKRYSSGMYVRLAFAVAAHLESEILIVDEVLAVGDAEFQKKCLGKMGNISKGEGRTVLFVSHNMGAIQQLCNQVMLLNSGTMILKSTVAEGMRAYNELQTSDKSIHYQAANADSIFRELFIKTLSGQIKSAFDFNEDIAIYIKYNLAAQHLNARLSLKIIDRLEKCIFNTEKAINELNSNPGEYTLSVILPKCTLMPGDYKVTFTMHIPNIQILETVPDGIYFEVLETGTAFYLYGAVDNGCVFVDCEWETIS